MDCYKGKKPKSRALASRKEWNILCVRIITGCILLGMMKQAQASEDHIKSTVSQGLHDLHEQFHRAGCSTETPLSRGRQRRKRRGTWMEHHYMLGTFVISLLGKKSLYSSPHNKHL